MSWIRINTEEFSHETSRLDAMFWSSVLDRSAELSKRLTPRAAKVIAGDLFKGLYDWEPKLKDDPPEPAVAEFIHQLCERATFKKLRHKTVGDKYLAAASAGRLYRELMRTKEGRKNDLATIADLKAQIDTFKAMADPDDESTKQAIETLKDAEKELAASMAASAQIHIGRFSASDKNRKTDEEIDKASKGKHTDSSVEAVLEDMEAAEELADFDETAEGGKGRGIDGAASEKEMSMLLDESMMASLQKQDELKRILRIAGRMKIVVQQQKSKKPRQAPPPIGLTMGNDLTAVVPSELVYLADPDLEELFFQKFFDHGLVQYDRKMRMKEGRGPFVCCVDLSGSMHGQPERYAMAMFMAMSRVALSQHRKAAFIPFASYAGNVRYVKSSKELISLFNRDQRKDKIGGGTEFYAPLWKALDVIESEKHYKKADVVLITDGICSLSQPEIDRLKPRLDHLGARTLGIMVGGRRLYTQHHYSRYQTGLVQAANQMHDAWDAGTRQLLTASMNINTEGGLEELEWFRQAVTPML